MARCKSRERDDLEIMPRLAQKLLLVSLHVTHEVDVRHLGVQGLLVLVIIQIQVASGRDHERITLLKRVATKSVRSRWAKMAHL